MAGVIFEAVTALLAHDEVPNKEPVIPPDTFNDPVICCEPETKTVPFKV